MEVIIDGVRYVPMPEPETDKGLLAALELRLGDTDAGDNITVRQYLHALMETLWWEEDGFSGKRPFGNSGWQWDLITPLCVAGFIEGTVLKAETPEDQDEVDMTKEQIDAARRYVLRLIKAAMFGVSDE